MLKNLNYPLDFKFKITTLASAFSITDRNGNYLAYVRQKKFRLKEDVVVYNNESRSQELFRIQANQWIDFNASYSLTDLQNHRIFGKLARKGMRSIWKATYKVLDENNIAKFQITEDNAWIKVFDNMLGEIPVVGMLTGYILNPTYSAKDASGRTFFTLKKMPSFFGRRFQLDRLVDIDDEDETLVVLSFLMMVLLERSTG